MLGVSIGDDVVRRPSSKVVSPGHLKSNLGETVGHDLCPKSSQDFPSLNFAGGLQGVISPGQIKLVEEFAAFCKRMRAMSREKSTEYQSNQSNVHSTELKKKLVHSFGHCLNGKTIDGLCGVFSKSTNGNCYSCTSSSVDLVISVVGVLCDSISNKVNEKSNKTGGCTHKPTTYTLAHDFDEQKDGGKEFVQSANANLDSSIANFHTLISGQGLSKISSVVKPQSAPVLPIMKKRVSFAETDKFKSGPRIKLFEPEVIIDVDDKEYDHPASIISDPGQPETCHTGDGDVFITKVVPSTLAAPGSPARNKAISVHEYGRQPGMPEDECVGEAKLPDKRAQLSVAIDKLYNAKFLNCQGPRVVPTKSNLM